jgi:hypothetical protein
MGAALKGAMTTPSDDPEPRLPDALQRDLRRAFGAEVRIPESVHAALTAAARRRRLRPRWQRPVLLAAAALLLMVPLVARLLPRSKPVPAPLAREDFDGDGRVDVLDAYRLALALQRGQRVPPAFDLDGDGRVDARDIDRIAGRAVRIRG